MAIPTDPEKIRKIRRIATLAFPVLVILQISLFFSPLCNRSTVLKHPVIMSAKVYNLKTSSEKNGILVPYYFIHNDQTYKGLRPLPYTIKASRSKLMGKYYPVVFDSTNPGNNYLLLDSSDFAAYNIAYPDSLQWLYN